MYAGVLPECICVKVPDLLDPLVLELQTIGLSCGCWDQNPGPLEKPVLSSAEPLSSPRFSFSCLP